MIKQEIAEIVRAKLGIPRLVAVRSVDVVLEIIKEGLAAGGRIELRGFGVFDVTNRKTGVGRNPKTGLVVPIPSGKRVRFKAGKWASTPPSE